MKIKKDYQQKIIFEITSTGVLLSLAFIFALISNFLPSIFSDFLKLDLAIIFIVPIFAINRWRFGFIALFLSFIFGPIITANPDIIGYLSHGILLVARFIFIGIIMLFLRERKKRYSVLFWVLIYLIATLGVSFIMPLLNALIFTPLYLKLFKWNVENGSYWFWDLAKNWKGIPFIGFGIKNYFLANYALYLPFNLISFGLTSIIVMPLIRVCFKIMTRLNY